MVPDTDNGVMKPDFGLSLRETYAVIGVFRASSVST